MAILIGDGEVLENEAAQAMIRQTIDRVGRFVMAAPVRPKIGEIQEFAGLPLRCTRYVEREDALLDMQQTEDIWGQHIHDESDCFFEVEVVD